MYARACYPVLSLKNCYDQQHQLKSRTDLQHMLGAALPEASSEIKGLMIGACCMSVVPALLMVLLLQVLLVPATWLHTYQNVC